MHSMPPAINIPRPLGEIVRDVLARGDDRAWTMPQESRGAWSEERLAGWRTDPDVTTQLAALTSLDFSEHELGHGGVRIVSQREVGKKKSFPVPMVMIQMKHMLSRHCVYAHV